MLIRYTSLGAAIMMLGALLAWNTPSSDLEEQTFVLPAGGQTLTPSEALLSDNLNLQQQKHERGVADDIPVDTARVDSPRP